MKNSYLFLATAIIALASCSENTYLGDQEGAAQGNGAISFGSNLPTLTRAEDDHAKTLKYKFNVYATKTTEGVSSETADDDVTSNVFATKAYPNSSELATYNAAPYWVWWVGSPNGTASNTKGWEYVGAKSGTYGTTDHTVTLTEDQTIKYWDYSAKQYDFVAYSATYETGSGDAKTPKITKYQTSGFTVEGTAADLAGLYVADKITLTAGTSTDNPNNTDYNPTKPATGYNKIGDIVKFTFRSAGAKVRLGIYETINGYVVKNVNFRPNNGEFSATTAKAMLSGSFNGTSSSSTGTYNVTYNSTTGIAEFQNTASSANTSFDFGTFPSTEKIGTASTAPTWAGETTSPYYQGVLPNTDHPGNMILYVDYDLYNETTQETIHVKGAKAVVPQMYMAWKPNHAYTYLFKISDNTNGHTGPGTTPEGLYPITFDAVTIAATDGQEVGTITTVSTPAITTYQKGSVYDNVSESKHGITYANANGPIYITVNAAGTLKELTTANTKLYTVASGTTEADLVLNVKEKTEVTSGTLTVPLSAEETLQGITFATSTTAKFTPNASTTYAVEYKVSDVVASVYTAVADGTTLTKDKKYYTSNAGAGEFISNGTEVSNGSNYYEKTAGSPAVYQYKIIVVGS